jgi:biopolymer transport protein ExbB/TolQ
MDWALVLAVVAIVVSILLTYWRTVSGARQRRILEQQLENQKEELHLLRELVRSFNSLTESYDKELDSMRNQLVLTSGEAPDGGKATVDEATRAAEIELEKERQKAEKKRQKEETKRIKKMMKALEKE